MGETGKQLHLADWYSIVFYYVGTGKREQTREWSMVNRE
jgi:hypothetical protein